MASAVARQIREAVHDVRATEAMERRLRELVEIPSGSQDAAGLDRMEAVLTRDLRGVGLEVGREAGGVVLARATAASPGPRVLLVGHLDTVYPPGSPFAGLTPRVDDQGRPMLCGPGSVDMKGGLVVLLGALEGLRDTGRLGLGPLTVVLNRDEEIGSPASADTLAAVSADHDLALVLEPGFDLADGATSIVVERAGLARLRVKVEGVEAHAGNQPERGLSAVATASRMVASIDGLNAPTEDRLVRVCTFDGGQSINQVPGSAALGVDVRFRTLEQWEAVLARIDAIARSTCDRNPITGAVTRTEVEVLGLKVPMPRDPAVDAHLETVTAAASELGLRLVPGRRNGTSDGNNTARAGTPTLDGLGCVGVGMHVSGEEAVRAGSLPERAALLALTLVKVWGGA